MPKAEVEVTDQSPRQAVKLGDKLLTMEEARQISFEELASSSLVTDASEILGQDQFGPVLEDKRQLCGTAFVIVKAKVNTDGDYGTFVSLFVVTKSDDHVIVNDGSTGIARQILDAYPDQETLDSAMPILCRHGLRVSEYNYTDAFGKETPAKTFYIDSKL